MIKETNQSEFKDLTSSGSQIVIRDLQFNKMTNPKGVSKLQINRPQASTIPDSIGIRKHFRHSSSVSDTRNKKKPSLSNYSLAGFFPKNRLTSIKKASERISSALAKFDKSWIKKYSHSKDLDLEELDNPPIYDNGAYIITRTAIKKKKGKLNRESTRSHGFHKNSKNSDLDDETNQNKKEHFCLAKVYIKSRVDFTDEVYRAIKVEIRLLKFFEKIDSKLTLRLLRVYETSDKIFMVYEPGYSPLPSDFASEEIESTHFLKYFFSLILLGLADMNSVGVYLMGFGLPNLVRSGKKDFKIFDLTRMSLSPELTSTLFPELFKSLRPVLKAYQTLRYTFLKGKEIKPRNGVTDQAWHLGLMLAKCLHSITIGKVVNQFSHYYQLDEILGSDRIALNDKKILNHLLGEDIEPYKRNLSYRPDFSAQPDSTRRANKAELEVVTFLRDYYFLQIFKYEARLFELIPLDQLEDTSDAGENAGSDDSDYSMSIPDEDTPPISNPHDQASEETLSRNLNSKEKELIEIEKDPKAVLEAFKKNIKEDVTAYEKYCMQAEKNRIINMRKRTKMRMSPSPLDSTRRKEDAGEDADQSQLSDGSVINLNFRGSSDKKVKIVKSLRNIHDSGRGNEQDGQWFMTKFLSGVLSCTDTGNIE